MSGLIQTHVEAPHVHTAAHTRLHLSRTTLWLALITLAWKLVECAVSAYAAWTAHSPALLAFGSDTVVELISAVVVLSQFQHVIHIHERRAARASGILLIVLAFIVTAAAIGSLALHIHPDESRSGLAITVASLIAMPVLARLKRREAHRIHNAALAADAVQSFTCAYLALLTIIGLGMNLFFGIGWVDSLAALLAVPILLKEARTAWHGHFCEHC
jgi:divalent metal cation (Fe/Co/Zn/Cd) transporter